MKTLKEMCLTILFCGLILLGIAYAPDIKGAGDSELAFYWVGSDSMKLSIPYRLSGNGIMIRGESFLLVNPSPQRQYLHVIVGAEEYRIRYRMQLSIPNDFWFKIESVSLTDSTVTSSFNAQTI